MFFNGASIHLSTTRQARLHANMSWPTKQTDSIFVCALNLCFVVVPLFSYCCFVCLFVCVCLNHGDEKDLKEWVGIKEYEQNILYVKTLRINE